MAMSRSLAVKNRLPEPETLDDVLLPPLAAALSPYMPAIKEFAPRPDTDGAALGNAIAVWLDSPR